MRTHPLGTGCLLGVVAFFVAFGVAVLLVTVLVPALKHERPADLTPTPTLPVVTVEPTPRPSLPAPTRTATMVPERILLTSTPTVVPRATDTPTPDLVLAPSATPTATPTRQAVQRG